MRINPSQIPPLRLVRPIERPADVQKAEPRRDATTQRADRVERSSIASPVRLTPEQRRTLETIGRTLVGGRVDGPIHFESSPLVRRSSNPYANGYAGQLKFPVEPGEWNARALDVEA